MFLSYVGLFAREDNDLYVRRSKIQGFSVPGLHEQNTGPVYGLRLH